MGERQKTILGPSWGALLGRAAHGWLNRPDWAQEAEARKLWKLPRCGKGGQIKSDFPPLPQHLENSPPKTLRVSHSSHSFCGCKRGYFEKLSLRKLRAFLGLVSMENSSPKALRVSHTHPALGDAISKKLKPLQFLFACNTPFLPGDVFCGK
jgi:hypothetical protein